jgi:transcription elongation factor Elf1
MTKYFNEDYVHEIINIHPLEQEIQRIRERSMFSKIINCNQCGHRGCVELSAYSTSPALSIFKYTGHNPDSGELYFQCPMCKSTLSVDPIKMINTNTLDGITRSVNIPVTADKKDKSLLSLWTVLSVGFFSVWWL